MLLPQVHKAFGGELRAMFVGGAFTEPATLQFFYDLGIPVANGYGLTEAGTVITLNDFNPFRADTVGKPLPGMEVRIVDPGPDGIGEVAARGPTIMSHYLDDPELTAETIVDGWLMTGDLGRLDRDGHLQLFGRKKNMIVTAEGKNIYPEDIENVFEGLPVKEFCVFAANYLWPAHTMVGEQLVLVVRLDPGQSRHRRKSAPGNRGSQPALAELQAHRRLLALGRRFPAHRFAQDQARRPGGTDSRKARARGRAPAMKRSFLAIVNPAAGGGRCGRMAQDALAKLRTARTGYRGCRDQRSRAGHISCPCCLRARVAGNSLPWAATAPPAKSSTACFPKRPAACPPGGQGRRSASFPSGRAIPFCVISPIAAPNIPLRPLSKAGGGLATCFACITPPATSTSSTC